jgi:Tfp pilus assembly protein PilF
MKTPSYNWRWAIWADTAGPARRMLERFAGVDSAETASFVAGVAACGPGGVADPSTLVKLAERAVTLQPTERTYYFRLAFAHYRTGQYEAAAQRLNDGIRHSKGGTVADWFLLAMAHHRSGRPEEARSWLEKAIQRNDENARTAKRPWNSILD